MHPEVCWTCKKSGVECEWEGVGSRQKACQTCSRKNKKCMWFEDSPGLTAHKKRKKGVDEQEAEFTEEEELRVVKKARVRKEILEWVQEVEKWMWDIRDKVSEPNGVLAHFSNQVVELTRVTAGLRQELV